jgi:hypothetical protein
MYFLYKRKWVMNLCMPVKAHIRFFRQFHLNVYNLSCSTLPTHRQCGCNLHMPRYEGTAKDTIANWPYSYGNGHCSSHISLLNILLWRKNFNANFWVAIKGKIFFFWFNVFHLMFAS